MTDKRQGRVSALSYGAAFTEDLHRASETGWAAALAARKDYERGGVPIEYLLACDEGPDGTAPREL